VSWAVAAGETDLAMRIAAALVTQAVERPAWATASIAEQALSASGADAHPLRALVMGEAAWAAVRIGDIERAQVLLDESIEAQRQGARFTASVWTYAAMLFDRDRYSEERAIQRAEEALARAEAAGDVVGTIALRAAYAVTLIGWSDRSDEARENAERALAEARALGQPALIAMGLLALGETQVATGEAERGLAMLRESRALSTKINSTWQSTSALSALAALQAHHGDPLRAAVDLRELLESFRDNHDYSLSGQGALVGAVAVFCRTGRPDLAARADGQIRLAPTGAYGGFGGNRRLYERALSEVRAALGDQRYEALAAQEATRPLETFVQEMITSLDELLAKAQADQ